MRNRKTRQISSRISEYDYKEISKSKYTYSDAIEYFVDNVLNDNKANLKIKYHAQKKKIEDIKNKLNEEELELINLEHEMDKKGILKDLTPKAENSVQSILNLFERDKYNYTDVKHYMTANMKIVGEKQLESGLEPKDFEDAVLKRAKIKFKD